MQLRIIPMIGGGATLYIESGDGWMTQEMPADKVGRLAELAAADARGLRLVDSLADMIERHGVTPA